jgi:DNA-binding MarR family transcriptional regulator
MSRDKREIFDELITEVRLSQAATDRFDQAVADAAGLNRTDMRCLEIIDLEGPVTAGRLAEATGLTTAAITTVLDRLERAGHARRRPDPADRRRVLVEIDPEFRSKSPNYYAEHMRESERIYERYTKEQLALVLEFVRGSRELNEREAARLESQNRK